MPTTPRIILGSRSARRRELLALIVPAERIDVYPPQSTDELDFENINDQPRLEERCITIARMKNQDVRQQLGDDAGDAIIVTADTIIVGHNDDGTRTALGQPPDGPAWRDTVRRWFHDYYLKGPHTALTGLCVTRRINGSLQSDEQAVRTEIEFRVDAALLVDWYISTGEPQGKAGGYALQGAGEMFVERITGSPSNVIGLPLLETHAALPRMSVP